MRQVLLTQTALMRQVLFDINRADASGSIDINRADASGSIDTNRADASGSFLNIKKNKIFDKIFFKFYCFGAFAKKADRQIY